VSDDGLRIRWRETAPDRGLLTLALSEMDVLHCAWPETMQCNIVIERVPAASAGDEIRADVELVLGRRSPRVRAKARAADPYIALRDAFDDLRNSMPPYAGLSSADVAA
jgi:hypothetical protein